MILMKSDNNKKFDRLRQNILMKELRFAHVLKRELSGKNLAQVARDIGVAPSLLHDWYAARRSPNARNFPQLLKLSHYLGLTLEELIFDKPLNDKVTIASTTFTSDGSQFRVQIEKLKGK